MAKLHDILQLIMKLEKAGAKAEVTMADGIKHIGMIQDFRGMSLSINGVNLEVNNIEAIEEHKGIDLSSFEYKRVEIKLLSGETKDVIFVSSDGENVKYITEDGEQQVAVRAIFKIESDDDVVVVNKKKPQKKIVERTTPARPIGWDSVEPEESYEKHDFTFQDLIDFDKHDTPVQPISQSEDENVELTETAPEVSEEPEELKVSEMPTEEMSLESELMVSDIAEGGPDSPNVFEKALIEGDKASYEMFITHPNRMAALGYTEKEIERCQRIKDTIPWGMDSYKTAYRIYNAQKSKNGLARKYMEIALEECPKDNPNYKKIINALEVLMHDEDDQEYVMFWKKNSSMLKDNSLYCRLFIEAQLRIRNITVNGFEKELIAANKAAVKDYIENNVDLSELGYSPEDIERIAKAFKVANWDTSWYKVAARLYMMQLNKNSLAEAYYDSALAVSSKKSEEYLKILNALAAIRMSAGGDTYISFFKKYRERLKTNPNYCMSYANALLAKQDWDQLQKAMPMLEEQLAGRPEFIEKLKSEMEYYKTIPPFSLDDMPVLKSRYENEEIQYEQEKSLIEKLPERNALKTLLEIYFFQKDEKAYFELIDYALLFVVDDKTSMLKLYTMMRATENMEYVVRFMPRVPTMWCDADLVKKYLFNASVYSTDPKYIREAKLLSAHLQSIGIYRNLNAFESAIINNDKDEVLRFINNTNLLEELGYSDDEIEEILAVNVDEQLSEEIYTLRKILAFQDNKNHVAERYLFEAYYSNKIDMCNRLFPLLIEEKRGELIYELFDFDRSLKNNLTSLHRFYYLAFCMVEKDDEKFFETMEPCWRKYPEDEILERMISIVSKTDNDFLLKQLELQKNKPHGNEFETALIECNMDAIRNYVKNASLLVELGYTPDEIQKINKIFTAGVTNTGATPVQVANRVYFYQKNKNNLAERLYLKAAEEESKLEDKMTAYKALYQIYTAQRNYEMVCKIYEEHLYTEMADKFNRTYANTYCVALYEEGRFVEFIDYIKENADRWEGFSLSANLLYVASVQKTHELDDFIWANLNASTYHPEIVAKYIINVLTTDIEEIYTDKFADIFNMFYPSLPDDDVASIAELLKNADSSRFDLPKAAIMAALSGQGNTEELITSWYEYICQASDGNRKTDIIVQLDDTFPDMSECLVKMAVETYKSFDAGSVSEYKAGILEGYIYSNLSNEIESKAWLELKERDLMAGKGSINSLDNCLNLLISLNRPERFWQVYLSYCKNCEYDLPAPQLFDLVLRFYTSVSNMLDVTMKSEVADELIKLSGEYDIDYANCQRLAEICCECNKTFEEKIYRMVLENYVGTESDSEGNNNNENASEQTDYISYLDEILISDGHNNLADKYSGIAKYIELSDEEMLVVNRLKNSSDKANLWVTEEINILAKAIICDPGNSLYWRLYRAWISGRPDAKDAVIGGILYQLSSQGPKELTAALKYAVESGLKNNALELVLKMMDMRMPDMNITAQKNIKKMVEMGWFNENPFEENIPGFIKKIAENISLADVADYEWNSVCVAVMLALIEPDYEILISEFSEYLSKESAKQCCVVIANMMLTGNTALADKFFACMESSYNDIPYKQLITDLYGFSKMRALTEAEKCALRCVQIDNGNALGVYDLLGFYCDMCVTGQNQTGLETVQILMKYTSYDPILFEVAACFMKDMKDIDSRELYYRYMYEYLELSHAETPAEYAVGMMVCGENYLRANGRSPKSFVTLVDSRFPNLIDSVRKYQMFCDNIEVGLRQTEHYRFAAMLFEAVFSGNWVDVIEYMPGNDDIDSILSNHVKTDNINVADDYFRSMIRSIVCYMLKHSDDRWSVVSNSKRLRILWDYIGNVGCSYDYIYEAIQELSAECAEELRPLWNLDIETVTVYKKFFGKYILMQEHCQEAVKVYNVFLNARSGDVFSNKETQEYVSSLDEKRGVVICRSYEQLYLRQSGPSVVYATGKSIIKDSDYENNIFSTYLKQHTSDYYTVENRYERFEKKYELICAMNDIHSYRDIMDRRFDINSKRQIISLRSLYYYYSVLMGKVEEEFAEYHQIEVINAITIALSDDSYMAEIAAFLKNYGLDVCNIFGVLLLAEQGRLDDAARTAIEKIPDKWKGYICARVANAYGNAGRDIALCRECVEISKSTITGYTYWLKNYKHAKNIMQMDPESYFSDIVTSDESYAPSIAERKDELEPLDDKPMFTQTPIVPVTPTDVVEDIFVGLPAFVEEFVSAEHDDEREIKLSEKWKALKEASDNGNDVQDALSEQSLRICLHVFRNKPDFDEELMEETFNMVRRYSIRDTYVVNGLHSIFNRYVRGYTDLDQLATSVSEHSSALKCLCYEQSIDSKSETAKDIVVLSKIIEIMDGVAADMSSEMDDDALRERLRSRLMNISQNTRGTVRFRSVVNALIRMIQDKINLINYVPNLVVSHMASESTDASGKISWKETWTEDAVSGKVRGVVVNKGGAPANEVKLRVYINSEPRGEYSIDSIASGRIIPFSVEYDADDVIDGKVLWNAAVSYYDENRKRRITSQNVFGEINVKITEYEWGYTHTDASMMDENQAAEGASFYGRKNELGKLQNYYSPAKDPTKYPSLLVSGLRRVGKSSVIKYFVASISNREDVVPVFVDAQGISVASDAFFKMVLTLSDSGSCYKRMKASSEEARAEFTAFEDKWLAVAKQDNWYGYLPEYFMELSELLGNRKVIFVLDEMEYLFYSNLINQRDEEPFFSKIRYMIQNGQAYVSFIFCGSDKLLCSCLDQKSESQMFQVLDRVPIGRMGINEIRDMFESYNSHFDIKFGNDAIDAINYYTNGQIWYTKTIAHFILQDIIDEERIIRREIHVSDVDDVVEQLINGDLGLEKIDLLDKGFGLKRQAIIHVMARLTKSSKDSVSANMIQAEMEKRGYVHDKTGEAINIISEDELLKNLNVLEKMDFIEKDPRKDRAYRFTTELYRLLMSERPAIDKFTIINGGIQ